jgi:hypothetical protein
VIPGGGNSEATPLWLKATKLICVNQTDDGSPNDEIYAVIASVDLNWDKLWESRVLVSHTPIYESMNKGDVRVTNLAAWGPPDGGSSPIRDPKNAVIIVKVFENDGGNVFIAMQLLKSRLLQYIGTLHPGYSYAQIASKLTTEMENSLLFSVSTMGAGDDPLSRAQLVTLSQEELAAARSGTVVKKPLEFYDTEGGGSAGKYILRFQLGREGVSTVVW